MRGVLCVVIVIIIPRQGRPDRTLVFNSGVRNWADEVARPDRPRVV